MKQNEGRIFVVPVGEGLSIDPTTGQRLTSRGLWVPPDRYWRRRIADGDAKLGDPPADAPAEAEAAPAEAAPRVLNEDPTTLDTEHRSTRRVR